MLMDIKLFLDVALCRHVNTYRSFVGITLLRTQVTTILYGVTYQKSRI